MQEDVENFPEVPVESASEDRDPAAWEEENGFVTEWDASMDPLTPDDQLDEDEFEEGVA